MFRKTTAITLIAALGIAMLSPRADAAMMAYLYLKGQKTGEVKGGVTQKGREGAIAIIAMEQASKVPMSGGMPTGKINVGQLVVTKEVDKSSPILRQMLTNNENISMASLKFWTPQLSAATGVGAERQHYTINLTNARISSIKTVMHNVRDPQLMRYEIAEEIAITYDRADWIWMDGGVVATETAGYAMP